MKIIATQSFIGRVDDATWNATDPSKRFDIDEDQAPMNVNPRAFKLREWFTFENGEWRHNCELIETTAEERRRTWSKAGFKARVDHYAPNAWEAFRSLRHIGNATAVQVWEDGWLTYSEIVSDDAKTAQMVGALVLLGVFSESEADAILNGPDL